MAKRKARGGILTRMRDAPSKPSHKRLPRWKRVLRWIGGGVLGVLILIALLALVRFSFSPAPEGVERRAQVRVIAIEIPDGDDPEVTAMARVSIEGRPLLIPLNLEEAGRVREGTRLQVRYRKRALQTNVSVEAWEVIP